MALATKKLIILDRDGVLNAKVSDPISNADDWEALSGSMDAVAFLTQSGYTVVVATNQSGIGRGLMTMRQLNEVHGKMNQSIQKAGGYLSGIWFCPHRAEDHCDCRKPRAGMIIDILDRLNAEAKNTWLVGDRLRDLQAIDAVGGNPVLVLSGSGKETLSTQKLPENTQVFDNLLDFAKYRMQEDVQMKNAKDA
ncbi:D-glycero-beta-D-manno-heptose 1,7-bisphosphate 7-phosphatase [Stenoxybacter acetivorans]|uniref:D-glycero-beta-D-manno-heptose 1,7-bisphosphate 7-phosphatase n=1 Tax=Stenoxybacter acetivorans TaxID=422441 RepID=UPI00056D0EE2|nr:D-glycero-beta-D-manno-heptose 1,7-bisphosphate 7-phosphatase [Stenoxybacter acetivorans]